MCLNTFLFVYNIIEGFVVLEGVLCLVEGTFIFPIKDSIFYSTAIVPKDDKICFDKKFFYPTFFSDNTMLLPSNR